MVSSRSLSPSHGGRSAPHQGREGVPVLGSLPIPSAAAAVEVPHRLWANFDHFDRARPAAGEDADTAVDGGQDVHDARAAVAETRNK